MKKSSYKVKKSDIMKEMYIGWERANLRYSKGCECMSQIFGILIVDDQEINRAILKNIFALEYNVYEAECGVDALKILEEGNDIDVILLDILMPKMNGLEFLNIIKKNEEFSKIPVIVNTGQNTHEQEIKALDLGADDFISKPYDSQVIKRRVKNLVQKYRFERKQIEEALRDTSERLEILIDTVPGGIGIFELNNGFKNIYYNDGFCELLGYTQNEMNIIKKNGIDSCIYKEDKHRLINDIAKRDERGLIYHNNIRLIKKDGSLIWVGLSAKKLKSSNGRDTYHTVFLDMTEEKEAEEKLVNSLRELRYKTERDSLTGIYNREIFYERTKTMINSDLNKQYIILMWNIDKFKVINELFGSEVGDQVLIEFATFLRNRIGYKGTYARMEADHFATCTTKDFIDDNIEPIKRFFDNISVLSSANYRVLAHAGVYEIIDVNMPVNLMCDRANLALHTVSGNYMQRFAYYDENLQKAMMYEQELIGEMENALKENQFYINIQPIVSTDNTEIISAEALVRWNHPTLGFISPGVFIPLFEKNGFITKLDRYVWRKVCEFLSFNKNSGVNNVPISVNVSRVNFYDVDLCQYIIELIEEFHIEPELLKLEITESAYTDNPSQLLSIMSIFQAKGFKILMDDFGSGYSSLNMLKEVPVDILKIDMKFIEDMEDSERSCNILFSMIQMGKSLNMDIVAEGVETKRQFELLSSMGCDYIQGYYFSKPVSENDFRDALLDKERNIIKKRISTRRKGILVVDDIEINRASIMANLEEKFHILEASNGKEALKLLDKSFAEVNLIITDIMMPKMNGFELLIELKKSVLYKNIPVIVITGLNEIDKEIMALELGAIDVIIKPFEPIVLMKRIENLLMASTKENIFAQVQAHGKYGIEKRQISDIVNDEIVGICRLRLYNSIEFKVSGVVYVNDEYFSIHEVKKLDINKLINPDFMMSNVVESDLAEIKLNYEQAVKEKNLGFKIDIK